MKTSVVALAAIAAVLTTSFAAPLDVVDSREIDSVEVREPQGQIGKDEMDVAKDKVGLAKAQLGEDQLELKQDEAKAKAKKNAKKGGKKGGKKGARKGGKKGAKKGGKKGAKKGGKGAKKGGKSKKRDLDEPELEVRELNEFETREPGKIGKDKMNVAKDEVSLAKAKLGEDQLELKQDTAKARARKGPKKSPKTGRLNKLPKKYPPGYKGVIPKTKKRDLDEPEFEVRELDELETREPGRIGKDKMNVAKDEVSLAKAKLGEDQLELKQDTAKARARKGPKKSPRIGSLNKFPKKYPPGFKGVIPKTKKRELDEPELEVREFESLDEFETREFESLDEIEIREPGRGGKGGKKGGKRGKKGGKRGKKGGKGGRKGGKAQKREFADFELNELD